MYKRLVQGLRIVAVAILVTACGGVGVPFAPGLTGQVFVTDLNNHRIVRIDNMSGAGWTTFGAQGSGTNQFSGPQGIFVTRPARSLSRTPVTPASLASTT